MSDWISELLTVQEQIRKETVFDDPIERLLQEHRIIAALTCTLEVWSMRAEDGDEVDVECVDALVNLLTEFVDEVHHEKEESLLVPQLVALGLMPEQEDLRAEHQHERYLVGALRYLTRLSEPDDPLSSRRFATLARELVAFQRAHLESETRGIYGVLERLDEARRAALKRELQAFDRRKEPVLRAWRARLERLLERRGGSLEERPPTEPATAIWA